MANQVDVERFKEGGLNEIYQDVETKFAFVTAPKEGNKQCHPLVKCRDFLHDAVDAQLRKGKVSIYGFNYAHGKNPVLDLKKMRMLVKKADNYTDAEFKNHNSRAKKLLVHYEKMAGFATETKILRVKGNTALRVYVSDGTWMKAPHLISLYTLLIRLSVFKYGAYETESDLQKDFEKHLKDGKGTGKYGGDPNDIKYLKQTRAKWALVMEKNDKLVHKKIGDNYPKVNTDSLHNRGGIVSLITGVHFNVKLKETFAKL